MRKKIIYTALFFLTINLLNAQSEKEINAEMKHVTVFPDRAQIDHEATVAIPAGTTILKLVSLSPYIDPQGIQVKGIGDFTILSINFRNNYLQNLEDSPEIKNLRSQLESLQMKVEDENAAILLLKEKEAFLVANRAALVARETTFSIEQMKNMMELYTSNMDQVITSTVKKNRLIKDYEKQIAAIQKQLSEKLVSRNRPSGEIFITVSSEKQVNGKLNISYIAMNAGWYPSYDVRVADIKTPVTIFYKANVYQNTGVQWENVKLSFSNATPWVSGDIPVIYPWFIDYFYSMPVMRSAKSGAGVAMAAENYMMDRAVEEIVMETSAIEAASVPVMIQTGQTTVTFDISIPYTVMSDGKVQTVEIQRLTAPADYKYVSIPKLSQSAYLTANIVDWAQLNLQSGEASLYFENTFVGKTNLDANQLKDTLTISLGSDNSILVKREKRKDFTSKRVIGANKTETYSFLLTVRNNKSSEIKISLQDQIPVSSNSGITVEAVELSGGRRNAETGVVTWDIDMKPAETREIIFSYTVKYPKDRTLILE